MLRTPISPATMHRSSTMRLAAACEAAWCRPTQTKPVVAVTIKMAMNAVIARRTPFMAVTVMPRVHFARIFF
jgi:hypothetical protein